VRIYNRTLGADEILTDMEPETKAPKLTLAGTLAEGVREEAPSYPLEITSTDGAPSEPGVGVRQIRVEVDGT
jgi:hypothetical protein